MLEMIWIVWRKKMNLVFCVKVVFDRLSRRRDFDEFWKTMTWRRNGAVVECHNCWEYEVHFLEWWKSCCGSEEDYF